MDCDKILKLVDHTLLLQTATWDQIRKLCQDALYYQTATVCIPPIFVKPAKEFMGDKMAVCTVIGFPNGYETTPVKVYETQDAIENGADEIDMVVRISDIKEGNYNRILDEIRAVKKVCGNKILKVIIETCLLTEEEKIKMCKVVTDSGANYIKTSTGFSTEGATFKDIELFSSYVGSKVKIKAAGGIQSMADAEKFIQLGASRLGTSRMVKLMEQEKGRGGDGRLNTDSN